MASDTDNIELRSEKARRIIGEVPPLLVRSGIGIITAVLVALFIVASTISYPESVTVEATLTSYHDNEASFILSADSLIASRLPGNVRLTFEPDTPLTNSNAAICGTVTGVLPSSPLTVTVSTDSLSPTTLPNDSTLHGRCRLLLRDRTILSTIFHSLR